MQPIDEYIDLYRGWNVGYMPLFPHCKQPCLPRWKELATTPPTSEQVTKWKETYWNPMFWQDIWDGKRDPQLKKRWQKALSEDWKKAGVADKLTGWAYDGSLSVAVIGSQATGLALVDIEDIAIISEQDRKAILGNEWETPIVKTGKPNGYHIYVRMIAKNAKGPNGEIRADGQYVVAAPSVHPNGFTYTLIKRCDLKEIPPEKAEENLGHFKMLISATKKEDRDEVLEFAKTVPARNGDRSDWIFALTSYYKNQGLPQGEVLAMLLTVPICAAKIRESAEDWWVEYEWDKATVGSACGLIIAAAKKSGIIIPKPILDKIQATIDQGKLTLEKLTKATGKMPQIDPDTGEKVFDDNHTLVKIPKRILSPSKASTVIGRVMMLRISERDTSDKSKIWRYDGGIWKPDGEGEIVKIIDAVIGDLSYGNGLRETLRRIRSQAAITAFDNNPCLFPTLDGVVDLSSGVFREATPDDYLTFRYGAEFNNPKADYRLFLWFLCSSLPDPRDVLMALDIITAIAIRLPFDIIVLLFGGGSNGKGIFEKVILALFTMARLTAIRLEEMRRSRFGPGALLDKDVWIVTEVETVSDAMSVLKAESTGE